MADALDSGSSEGNFVKVQVLLPAPHKAEQTMSALPFVFEKRKDMTIQTKMQDTAAELSLAGHTVAITGSTGGLGWALCRYYMALGAHLILLNRDAHRTEAQIAALQAELPEAPPPRFIRLDLLDLTSLHTAAAELATLPLDILVHNAGLYAAPRKPVAEVYDNIFAVNFLSPYCLTRALLPTLASRGGRVVTVGSIAAMGGHIKVGDPLLSNCKRAARVYGNAKRHLILSLASLLKGTPVSYGIGHPGITPTGITSHYPSVIRALIKWPMRLIFPSPAHAARPIVAATLHPHAVGEWYGPRVFGIWGRPHLSHYPAPDEAEMTEIYQTAEKGYAHLWAHK